MKTRKESDLIPKILRLNIGSVFGLTVIISFKWLSKYESKYSPPRTRVSVI